MKIIQYDPFHGMAVLDGIADDVAQVLVDHPGQYLDGTRYDDKSADGNFIWGSFGTENVFFSIRVLIAKGILDYQEFKFRYQGNDYSMDQYARIADWPVGFCEHVMECSGDILDANSRLMKKLRKENKDA